jgi:hypothetical protein
VTDVFKAIVAEEDGIKFEVDVWLAWFAVKGR